MTMITAEDLIKEVDKIKKYENEMADSIVYYYNKSEYEKMQK